MHRLFAVLEPSLTVTEQNLADRVRYILRSNIFDVAELERLRREAVPSSDENAAAEDAAPQMVEQPANVDAVVNTPVVVDSNDDGTVAQELELEHMRSTLEEAIVETRSTPLENRPRLPRIALSKRNRAVVRALNPMLVTYLEASRDLCETDSILFGAALAFCRIIGAKVSTAGRATGHSSAIPAWRRRIEERIAKARALIGRLICFRSGNNRPRIMSGNTLVCINVLIMVVIVFKVRGNVKRTISLVIPSTPIALVEIFFKISDTKFSSTNFKVKTDELKRLD
ncbi:unnamed protein product [Parnassius apollo]|uniref:(apollo) hypothetical protein n=1 Tax=Parnassius apollo TaxID=110799 RepID=A0A8S3XXZ6_PARAO|nr:unnamed protein product [Parnassius apollo]